MTHKENSYNTKKAFSTAFKNLLLKKPFSKITISELIRECNLNRKTFYYHFDDIYDLMAWTIEEEAFDKLQDFDIIENPQKAFLFAVNYIKENSFFLNCIYDSVGREQMKRCLYHDMEAIARTVIVSSEQDLGLHLQKSNREFLIGFYTEGIAGMLVNTFQEKGQVDIAGLVENFTIIIKKSIPATIKSLG